MRHEMTISWVSCGRAPPPRRHPQRTLPPILCDPSLPAALPCGLRCWDGAGLYYMQIHRSFSSDAKKIPANLIFWLLFFGGRPAPLSPSSACSTLCSSGCSRTSLCHDTMRSLTPFVNPMWVWWPSRLPVSLSWREGACACTSPNREKICLADASRGQFK